MPPLVTKIYSIILHRITVRHVMQPQPRAVTLAVDLPGQDETGPQARPTQPLDRILAIGLSDQQISLFPVSSNN